MIPKIKYIAAYQISPISSITYLGEVQSIEQWKDSNKYVVNFKGAPEKIKPVIQSQNPDLKHLDEVLKSKEATSALLGGEQLSLAHELSRANDAIFQESLLLVKRALMKARAYQTTGYSGEEDLLRVAGSIANMADALYDEMLKVNTESNKRGKKTRLSE